VNWALNSNIDSYNKLELNVRANKNLCSIQFVEQVCLFNSIRRTRIRTRSIRSNKISISFNSLKQKKCTQFCSNLELNASARVQFNIEKWFVKSLSFNFFCIENCLSEIFFMTFSSKKSYFLMIEFDERKNDDSTRWLSFNAWTTYWWFRQQNISRNVRIDDIKYREICDMKTFQYVISKQSNSKAIRCKTRKFRMQRIF
jgi:hypothetical protein